MHRSYQVQDHLQLADQIFEDWRESLGEDFTGYRNHVYRVLNFAFALCAPSEVEQSQLMVAGVFHDLGIWSDNNFDYIEPSVARANTWLKENGHDDWQPAVATIIREHHKLTRCQGPHARLAEAFRKADLADVSLGLIRPGLERTHVRAVRGHFSNSGFHKGLLKKAGRYIIRHPLRPMPMMRW